jgi:hypothetical protein
MPAGVAPAGAAAGTAPPAAATEEATPSFMREPGAARLGNGLSRWQRWAIAAGGGAALLAIALAVFAELRDSGSYEHIVLTLPQSGEQARRDAASVPPPLAQAQPEANAPATASADLPARVPADMPADMPAPHAAPAAAADPAPEQAAPARATLPPPPATRNARASAVIPARSPAAAAAAGPAASATYRLQIQPWGVVYVDGVDRGVSPPVKRLVLTPGRHTIRIANPNFHDRVLEVDTSAGSGRIAVDFSDEPR